ncbi:MAG: hypothetical protein WA364_23280 [Candidatus Nitrosopolaris sp.]
MESKLESLSLLSTNTILEEGSEEQIKTIKGNSHGKGKSRTVYVQQEAIRVQVCW